ncbi:MAG: phosphoheptose isomerase [Bacteroidota bacterium]
MKGVLSLAGEKEIVFAAVEEYLAGVGLRIQSRDMNRPWGGFLVLEESQAALFAKVYFPDVDLSTLKIGGKLSPKILMVQAHKRLSWQYHHRRAEIWKLVAGTAGVAISDTDQEGPVKKLTLGEVVRLKQGQRHRLIGLDGWGMVAEIWQHIDARHPSDENDIVRLQDDFGR